MSFENKKTLKIVFASDSFKGSLTSLEANHAMAEGVKRAVDIEPVFVPISDGGDGLIDCLSHGLNLPVKTKQVCGPLYDPVMAKYAVSKDLAVIEMAEASGIILSKNNLHPLDATTYGTGELIREAIESGVKHIILGLGGSATTDGGMGALMALGAVFYDKEGNIIERGCGRTAAEVADADLAHLITDSVKITILCDVDYKLLGKQGAAAVFSPQKGADENEVLFLDNALANYASILCRKCPDYRDLPGTGAAGGLGYGLISVCNAKLVPGMQTIMDMIRFEDIIADADIVFTGEGKIDYQSSHGKAPGIIASVAKKYSVPSVVIGGCTTPDADELREYGAALILSSSDPSMSLEYAFSHAKELLADCSEKAIKGLLNM